MKTGKAIVQSSKSRRPFDRREVTGRTEEQMWGKNKGRCHGSNLSSYWKKAGYKVILNCGAEVREGIGRG